MIDVGEGEPVLLLHGYPQSLLTWRHQIPVLAKTHRVIAVDWFGWGESERGLNLAPRYWDEVTRIGQLLDTLGLQNCNLLGHDYGGFLALGFAQKYPERIKRLAIINSRAHRTFPVTTYLSFWVFCALARLPFLRQILQFVPFGRIHRHALGEYVRRGCFDEEVLEQYLSWMDERAGRRWLGHYFRYYELPKRADLQKGLGDIACPSSVIWGDRDPACPWSIAKDLAKKLPQAELTRIEHGSHYIMEERSDEVTKALKKLLDRPA